MNNLSLRALTVLACLFAPLHARAACVAYSCQAVHVDILYTNANSVGTVYVYTTGDESAMTDCTAVQGMAFTLLLNTEGGKAVYATLLAALAADRPVDIVANVGSSTCQISYVRYRRQ